ncbi:1,25-dihydroxyvitamin D(3) 24-hydroxylase, mitochondrial-like [Saccoglossus kowalevskii]|uniref:1,25-dihydroxyvitamin D(3) 24-hydroxylase, mitochondrial-like n=1 Tax=Saccoglossus kowalevskii TaxID=10224 RepID=A0ABM0MMB2_SACKO|nr:PREDICTED: 1,25-dihydroxyvitamin D(3) 24-hydroxylase, mitochondrial-like [Saccoglossus kowalevskii]
MYFFVVVLQKPLTGNPSTTNTVIFILDLLAWNPEAQEKLYQEIKNVIPEGKSVSQEYLKELHYLKAVVKESMRLRPVTPLLVRILDTDVVLCGYNVPAGKVLTIHSTAMGRNPKLFPNPEKFLPDRWLRSNKESHDINQFTIQPFGFGPRQCVGRRVAELEIYITLTKILQNFRLEPNSDKPLEMTTRLITVPATKLNLKFRDRD